MKGQQENENDAEELEEEVRRRREGGGGISDYRMNEEALGIATCSF